MAYLTTGAAALQLGMKYHTLVRRLRGTELPGVIRVGSAAAFDPEKLGEVRQILRDEGVIKDAAAEQLVLVGPGAETL